MDIRIIREILAHGDINDTMLYTKVASPPNCLGHAAAPGRLDHATDSGS